MVWNLIYAKIKTTYELCPSMHMFERYERCIDVDIKFCAYCYW